MNETKKRKVAGISERKRYGEGWSCKSSHRNLVKGESFADLKFQPSPPESLTAAAIRNREEVGVLHLGIRRAAQPRNGLPDSIIKNRNSYPIVLSPVANTLSSNGTFPVFYRPRSCKIWEELQITMDELFATRAEKGQLQPGGSGPHHQIT